MIKYIKNLFSKNKLQDQIDLLKKKLAEKQNHIDTTNAYWKKKMNETNKKKVL